MSITSKEIIRNNFLFGSGFTLDLEFVCMIRNFSGQTEHSENVNKLKKAMTFDVIIYDEKGNKFYEKKDYATVPYHSFYELKSSDLECEFDYSKEYLVNIRYNKDKKDHETSSREGAVFFNHRNDKTKTCAVLYDALPHIPNKKDYSRIALLAHKCWVSEEIDCHLYFCNLNTSIESSTINPDPLLIKILNEAGDVLYSGQEKIYLNSIFKFDVKKYLPKELKLDQDAAFLNIVASASNSQYPIYSLLKNSVSHDMAIEHSLPPYYYAFPSDIKIIRDNFIKNF